MDCALGRTGSSLEPNDLYGDDFDSPEHELGFDG